MHRNVINKKLREGNPVIGTFVRMDSISVEILGHTGWDFVIIDVEHGVHTMENVSNMVRAARSVGVNSIVRVPGNDPIHIMRALDAGADGVQVPQLTTMTQVKDACKAARYYPRGVRGACAYSAATGYSTIPFPEHITTTNEEAMVVIHVENAWAAEHIEEILTVDGIDVIFCGPWDMSQSLGIPGQTSHPKVAGLIEGVLVACKKKDVPTGIFVQRPEQLDHWLERGVMYFACSVDVGMYAEIAAKNAKEMREQIDKRMGKL